MRVAVVDIGTNSTRLLVAHVSPDGLTELERRTTITRLGEGVDATGALGEAPQQRVFAALDAYAEIIEAQQAEVRTAVLTSAVRDATNGAQFTQAVQEGYGLSARTLSGDQEARLTFLGATAARHASDTTRLLVIDIGGGSTELVLGVQGDVGFHVSTQAGVVRHTERHVHEDPPPREQLDALAADARGALERGVPEEERDAVAGAVAVAGTATTCAAIDLALPDYDAARVEGHVVTTQRLGEMLDRLAALPLAERRRVPGLHPDRAPTILAGIVILIEVLRTFALGETEVSDRDILWGVALEAAR